MEGLTPGRIVLYVLSAADCREMGTDGDGQYAGGDAAAGDTLPAQVISIADQETGCCNLKVNLNGPGTLWARDRYYTADHRHGTWHWPARA
jgi:hypothetical protein